MAESGCLRDVKLANLEVINNLRLNDNKATMSSTLSSVISVDATVDGALTKTGTATVVQPAGTWLKNIFIRNAGTSAVAIAGHASDAGVTLQVGIDGNTDSVLGPATAAANTGNIIDGASANDAQSWPVNGVGFILVNGVGSDQNSHTGLHANLDSIAVLVAENNLYSAAARDLVVTITSKSADTNVLINASSWRLCFEFVK